jgi:outer membrane protein TolC
MPSPVNVTQHAYRHTDLFASVNVATAIRQWSSFDNIDTPKARSTSFRHWVALTSQRASTQDDEILKRGSQRRDRSRPARDLKWVMGKRCGVVIGMWAGVLALASIAQAQTVVSLHEAIQLARQSSGAVQGAQLDAQAQYLQARALSNLGGPSLNLNGFAGRVSNSVNLDLSQLAATANPLIGLADAALPGVALPTIPNALQATRVSTLSSVGVGGVWPLYTGGRIEAVQGLARGRAQEAAANEQDSEHQLASQVAQRYFTVQLARAAEVLRADVVVGIAAHQREAVKLESAGLIARIDRLKADLALDNARRDQAKAHSDLALADVALQRLLALPQPAQPSTPLFVNSEGPGPLADFVQAGRLHNPAWQKLAAKREQAAQSLALQGQAGAPNVVALANYNLNLNRDSGSRLQPNWQVGVFLSMPLLSRIDHAQMRAAARLQQQRVELSAQQAERDIPTLIESQWRAVENARVEYLTGASAITLAEENLRLQRISFAQAQTTGTDVTDAQLQVAKSHTERLQAAHDYVLALSRLLEACGQPDRLAEFAARADIKLGLNSLRSGAATP